MVVLVKETIGQNLVSCENVSLGDAPVEQLDTLFDASLIQADWTCGLIVYTELKNRQDEIKDHFKGALCYYNLDQYNTALELFVDIQERTKEPIEYLNFYIGQIHLIHSKDTFAAIDYLFSEIENFPTSVFAHEKLTEILNIKSDYTNLIRLEKTSSINNESESVRIGNYYLSMNKTEEANQFFRTGCGPDAPNSCYLAAITSDTSNITARIDFLERSIAYSLKLNEQLINYYEIRDTTTVKEDSMFIVQDFKMTLAMYRSALSLEYDRNGDQANAVEQIDRAFFESAETPIFTAIFEQMVMLFTKYQLTDRILFYQDHMNANRTFFTKSSRSAEFYTDPVKRAVMYLDALSSMELTKVSSDTVISVLNAYVTLNYLTDFSKYVDILEKHRSDLATNVVYNLMAMRQFVGPKAMKFHARLNDPVIYLDSYQFTWQNVVELFMTQYNQQLEITKDLDSAITSINDLRSSIKKRGEGLPTDVQGDIYYAEGVAYWRLCRSANDCRIAESLFKQAIGNNPDLEFIINWLILTKPCGCG